MMKKLFQILGISLLFSAATPAYAQVSQQSPFLDFETFIPIENSLGTLTRTDTTLEVNINTQVDPGTYTFWWIVFNNPENCIELCDEADFNIPETNSSVFFATGGIVEEDGIANFTAEIDEGVLPTLNGQVLLGDGLVDSFAADIGIVVRTHGSVIPDLLTEQITTVDGGCSINVCEDIQFATFFTASLSETSTLVPETSSILTILGFGILGVVAYKKKS